MNLEDFTFADPIARHMSLVTLPCARLSQMEGVQKVHVVDSHTEGEPTRVVVRGAPHLSSRFLPECVRELSSFHDGFRTGVVLEPRGSSAVVGALLLPASDPGADVGVIFFNNVGYLGMCGHGTMGLVETLRFLGRLKPGETKIETPVGLVTAVLRSDGRISVRNVPSFRYRAGVEVTVPGYGSVVGDVAYGGNWFFLTETKNCPLTLENLSTIQDYAVAIREALEANGITGQHDAAIDHVEVFGPPDRSDADSKNFVLCPGLEYDRSPCGTGTSAKVACLAADGKLKPGQSYRQESIIGTLFEASYEKRLDAILPTITGRAYVTAEATLIFSPDDPLAEGIVAEE